MTIDDELKRRLQRAADRAGQDVDVGHLVDAVIYRVQATADFGGLGALGRLSALGGAALVLGGVLGATVLRPSADQTAVADRDAAVSVYECPDGAAVATVHAGDRLFVVGRTDDANWLAVRSVDEDRTRWVAAEHLELDADREVPVRSCTETAVLDRDVADAVAATVATTGTDVLTESSTTVVPGPSNVTTSSPMAPSVPTSPPVTATNPPTSVPSTASTAPSTVAPSTTSATTVPDDQPPTLQVSVSRPEIFDASWSANCAAISTMTAVAADDTGVTSVVATWSGLPGSPHPFTRAGANTWTAQFGPFSGLSPAFDQLVSITVTARDAAGNSRSAVVQVRVWGTCLL